MEHDRRGGKGRLCEQTPAAVVYRIAACLTLSFVTYMQAEQDD